MESELRKVLFEQLDLPTELDPSPAWRVTSWTDLEKQAELQGCATPFSDAGDERTLSWISLGAQWELNYKNEIELDRLGEQIAAALQLTVAEGEARELEVMREDVRFVLELSNDVQEPTVEQHHSESRDRLSR